MCGSDRVNSGDTPTVAETVWAILSQAAKAEGATTIPARGVGSSEPKRPALCEQVMIWSDLHGNVQQPKGGAGVAIRREHSWSDFGELSVVANRFQRARDAFVLDPDAAALRVLRPYEIHEMAKTGDGEKRMLIVEYGLQVDNPDAHGIAADLTTS